MASNSLKQGQIVHVCYQFAEGNWIADAQVEGKPLGLVGYQNQDLEICKKLSKEGLDLYFDGNPYRVIESIKSK